MELPVPGDVDSASSVHSHGPGGDHSHTGTTFTQAVSQADAIRQALAGKRPEFAGDFERNYLGLKKDLLALDQSLQTVVSASTELPLLASHPVYQYLARRYAL